MKSNSRNLTKAMKFVPPRVSSIQDVHSFNNMHAGQSAEIRPESNSDSFIRC